MRRRGKRSATWPDTRNNNTPGRNWASPTRPKSSGRWVNAYTCHPTAMACISEERVARKRAIMKNRKLGYRKATRPDTTSIMRVGDGRIQFSQRSIRGNMATEKWKFDTVHSTVGFSVRHLMISRVHGAFKIWSGALETDDAHPENTKLA